MKCILKSNELSFNSYIGIKHYLPIGIEGEYTILCGNLYGYTQIKFNNLNIGSGHLCLTLTNDNFKYHFNI